MIDSIEQWKLSRKISPPLITLLAYSEPRLTIDMNENNRETIVFDYLLRQLESVQRTISTYIRKENHGIALKHLRRMLIPVSISILDDARHIAIAAVASADLLVSWNFKHIVHFEKIQRFNAVNIEMGYKPLLIYSPREVTRYGSESH
ncbi:MAG: hypothetical protein HY578_08015 [Nitrospinae bacterium]|nr:hypothetical protein [Nitrospinota bacterium]